MMPAETIQPSQRTHDSLQSPARSPQTLETDDWLAAHRQACANEEPILIRARHYCDDRGWSLMNLMSGVLRAEGQINFSCQYPGVIKAWHRHRLQTDFWMCAVGHIKAGIFRERDGKAWTCVIGEKNPGVLIIPPSLWHGAATVGPDPAGLLYYVTHAFDHTEPDEERRPWNSVEGFQWHVEHR